jgi:hypothetical protein
MSKTGRFARIASWAFFCGGLGLPTVSCAASAPAPDAGLEIVISADGLSAPADFDDIRLEISEQTASGGWNKLWDRDYEVPSLEAPSLPTEFTLFSGPSTEEVLIAVTAYSASETPVVQRVAQVQVPADRMAALYLVLAKVCEGQVAVTGAEGEPTSTCPAGQSCQPSTGKCGPNTIDPATLPTFVPGQSLGAGEPSDASAGDATVDGAGTNEAAVAASNDGPEGADASGADDLEAGADAQAPVCIVPPSINVDATQWAGDFKTAPAWNCAGTTLTAAIMTAIPDTTLTSTVPATPLCVTTLAGALSATASMPTTYVYTADGGAVGATDTTLPVDSTSGWTASAYLLVDSEIMEVTSVGTATFAVSRAQFGTAAASHAYSATIANVWPVPVASAFGCESTNILVDSEVMHVADVSGNSLVVERGSQGTTVASHANGAGVTNGLVTVSSPSGWSAPAYLLIDSEVLQVTGIDGTAFAVTRGQLGTTAVSHANGVAVVSVITGVTVADATGISAGTVIRADAESMQVLAASSNALELARGQLGTTPATHASGAVVGGTTVLSSTGNGVVCPAISGDTCGGTATLDCSNGQTQSGSDAGASPVMVVRLSGLSVTNNHLIALTGDKPFVFLVAGDVVVDTGGRIDVSGMQTTPGPGGNGGVCGASTGPAGDTASGGSGPGGGAGGGFGTAGGAGSVPFGVGGPGTPPPGGVVAAGGIEPLRGGCSGGTGGSGGVSAAGAGGGAIEISASGTITLGHGGDTPTTTGIMSAGGGGSPSGGIYASGGGGSGGAILLASPVAATFRGNSAARANGGGSGGAGGPGADGHSGDDTAASGGGGTFSAFTDETSGAGASGGLCSGSNCSSASAPGSGGGCTGSVLEGCSGGGGGGGLVQVLASSAAGVCP